MHHYVYVDSKNRDSTSNGNVYTLSLTTPLRDITQVDLVSAKVPNSLYNVNAGDSMIINGVTYTLPPGFYSAQGLSQSLSQFDGVDVDYLCDEGRFIIYSSNPFTVNSGGLTRVTGNLSGTSTLADATRPMYSGQQILVSNTLIDLSTNEYIFLDIEQLRSTKMIDTKVYTGNTFSGSTISGGTFGMIPLDVASGQIKTFKEDSDYKIRIKYDTPLGSLSKVTVRWLDKNGQVLNFNGFDNNAFLLRVHTKNHEAPEVPEVPIKYVPLPPAPAETPKKSSSKIWILYLIVLGIFGGVGWYLFARQ